MSETDVCKEKHKQIDDRMDSIDDRLNNHSGRIKSLENYRSANEVEIRNLVEQIKNLVGTLKWMITSLVAMLAGFFIWYVQTIGR